MSKITTVKAIRIPNALLAQVKEALASRNNHARDFITENEWLVRAIEQKLAHGKRSRRKRKVAMDRIAPIQEGTESCESNDKSSCASAAENTSSSPAM